VGTSSRDGEPSIVHLMVGLKKLIKSGYVIITIVSCDPLIGFLINVWSIQFKWTAVVFEGEREWEWEIRN
jgi:hypothetical protein